MRTKFQLPGIVVFLSTMCLAHWAIGQETVKVPSPELLAKIRKANDDCLACHTEAGLKNPPKAELDLRKLQDTLVDGEGYKGSDHGYMECRQCHGQVYNDYPHAANASETLSPCEECHAVKVLKIEKQFEKSVHAKNLKETMACTTCHDVHLMSVAARLKEPQKIVAQDNKVCLGCHDSDLKFAKYAPDDKLVTGKKQRPAVDDIHDWLPNTRLHWQAVRCIECHTPSAKVQSHEILDKEKAEKKCVTCHSANSSLNTRLYRHMATEDQNKYGFINTVILSNSYVVGATRHPLLDTILIALVALTVAGVLGHGAIRIVMSMLRRRKNHE